MLLLLISLILTLIAYAGSSWLGRRHPSKVSEFTAKMLGLLLLTPLLLLLPKWQLDLRFLANVALSPATKASVSSSGLATSQIFLCLWLLGSGALLIRLCLHHKAMQRWIKSATQPHDSRIASLLHQTSLKLNLARVPIVLTSLHFQSPVVTGLFRTKILLPLSAEGWSGNTLSMVLLHECGHIQRRDLWLSTAAQICCALYWFNPLVWLLHRSLRSACELACDADVIARGADTRSYIHALCDVAESMVTGQRVSAAALAMADTHSLRSRVCHLLEKPNPRRPWITPTLLMISACSSLAVAVIRPAETPSLHAVESSYTPREVELRHSANPFPGDE